MIHRSSLALALVLTACSDTTTELVPGDGGARMDASGDERADGSLPFDAELGADADAGAALDGAAPACPPYRALCEGECVPVTDDPARCGGCDVTCAASEVCFSGACRDTCPEGLTACGGRCVDLAHASAHCGACDRTCDVGLGCVDGNCHPAVMVDPSGVACAGGGPPIALPGVDDGPRACAGAVAETTFRWALCSCEGVEVFNPLSTDAYDSRVEPWSPGGLGGGVGTNGGLRSTGTVDIGGSLWASSPRGGMSLSNMAHVAHDVRSGGELLSGNPLTIERDAFVVGDVTTSSTLRITGTLTHAPGATISGDVVAGAVSAEPVVVGDPCECDARERVPVIAIVEAARAAHDDALIGLDPRSLIDPGGPRRLDLPCGRYFLDAIDTNAPLVIAAHGNTALFIGADVRSTSTLSFVVEPGAELDVFIAGGIEVSGRLRIGDRARPASMRLYVGGVGSSLTLTNDVLIGGFVYAAEGRVVASNPVEVFGGVFAGQFENSGETTIHYDRAVLRAGDPCVPPPPELPCDACTDCGNQACVEGACGACTTSADCCAPLICVEGECVLFF